MVKTLMDIIRANEEAIFAQTVRQIKAESEHYAATPDEQLRASFVAFLQSLTELWESGREDGLQAYAGRLSQQRVPAGFRISEIQRAVGTVKDVARPYLEREYAGDLPSFLAAFRQLDEGFTTFIYAFSDAYARTQAEEIARLQEAALQAAEEKYRALFHAAHDSFFIIDMEGNYIDVNPAACEMVGYTRDELLSVNTMDLVPPEWPRRPLEERQAMWRRGGRLEVPLVARTGERVPVDMTFGVIQYHGQEAVLGVCRDMTEKKQAEAALRESEEQLRLITDALPVLISYVDSEQRYRFNNKAYEDWFGHPRTEVYGRQVKEVLGEPAYRAIQQYVEAVLSGQEVTFEMAVPYKDAGTRYVQATYVPHFGEQGAVEGFVALVTDIAKRKQAEEQLKAYEAELEEKVRLLEAQQAAIRELSTPVIQVWEGVLVLPIVGAVDSARARQIMEELLTRIVETQSEIVILDITGVPMVDTAVANHLIKTVQAARMLGARSIVTGLSPRVAQTVVELGVDLGGITTCANLRAGLETALGLLGVTVK